MACVAVLQSEVKSVSSTRQAEGSDIVIVVTAAVAAASRVVALSVVTIVGMIRYHGKKTPVRLETHEDNTTSRDSKHNDNRITCRDLKTHENKTTCRDSKHVRTESPVRLETHDGFQPSMARFPQHAPPVVHVRGALPRLVRRIEPPARVCLQARLKVRDRLGDVVGVLV